MKALQYAFTDSTLLQRALTHRSAGALHNERLEFLGDALLGFFIAEELCNRHPQAREDVLTRLRASLVRSATLAEIARELDLGAHLRLGGGERKSGGWRRDSILENTLEALVAAIYLDGGLETCRREVLRWFKSRLDSQTPDTAHKDPKTELQEYLQARGLPLPVYRTVAESGPEHRRKVTIECRVTGLAPVVVEGQSRRAGEQSAARQLLETISGAEK